MAAKYRLYEHLSRAFMRSLGKEEPAGFIPPPAQEPEEKSTRGVHPLFHQNKSIGLLSAEDPYFHPMVEGGHDKMKEHITNMGLTFHETNGKYGKPERSFIVHNPSSDQMADLGRKFGQESVIHSEAGNHRLIYTNGPKQGKFVAAVPQMDIFDQKAPQDYFTSVPGGGHFRLHFDWDRLFDMPRPAGQPAAHDPSSAPAPAQGSLPAQKSEQPTLEAQSLGNKPEGRFSMADNFVSIDDIKQGLVKSIKDKINSYTKELVDLRKKELSKSLDPNAMAAQDPMMAPEAMAAAPDMGLAPAPQDLCPLCHKEDKPGLCTCLGMAPMAPQPMAPQPMAAAPVMKNDYCAPGDMAKSDSDAYNYYLVHKQSGKVMGGNEYKEDAKDAAKDHPESASLKISHRTRVSPEAKAAFHGTNENADKMAKGEAKAGKCPNCGGKGGKSYQGTDGKSMSVACKTCNAPKAAKSEDMIDLTNEGEPGKRIKEVNGKHAGVTPDDKKSKVIEHDGSGGDVSKGKSLEKAALGGTPPMAKPPSGKAPGAAAPTSKPAAMSMPKAPKAPAAAPAMPKAPAVPAQKMEKAMLPGTKAAGALNGSHAAPPAAPAPKVTLPGQKEHAQRAAVYADHMAATSAPNIAPKNFAAPPAAQKTGSAKIAAIAAAPIKPFGKSEDFGKCAICNGNEHIGTCK